MRDTRSHFILDIFMLITAGLLICPPKVAPFTEAPFFLGVINGILLPFAWIGSLFLENKAPIPSYITNPEYWAGFSVGNVIIFSFIGYKLGKIYAWHRKREKQV